MLCFFHISNVVEQERNDREHTEELDERKKLRRVALESGDERIYKTCGYALNALMFCVCESECKRETRRQKEKCVLVRG